MELSEREELLKKRLKKIEEMEREIKSREQALKTKEGAKKQIVGNCSYGMERAFRRTFMLYHRFCDRNLGSLAGKRSSDIRIFIFAFSVRRVCFCCMELCRNKSWSKQSRSVCLSGAVNRSGYRCYVPW